MSDIKYDVYLRSREQPVPVEAHGYEFVELPNRNLFEFKRGKFVVATFRAEEVQGFVQHIPEDIRKRLE